MKRLRPTPSLVISLIALFVALGGTSYAAITALPRDSVGTKQLKNNAVTPAKIKAVAPLWHAVGAAGEPAFQNGWVNEGPTSDETAGFAEDRSGLVRLKGVIQSGTNDTVFTLPAGYRPSKNVIETMLRQNGPNELIVHPDGGVVITGGLGFASLDGVTFTAGE